MNDWLFRLHRVTIDFVIEGLAKETAQKRKSSRRRGSKGNIMHISPDELSIFPSALDTGDLAVPFMASPDGKGATLDALPLHQATPGKESDAMTSPGTYFSTPQSDSALDSGRFRRYGATASMLRKQPPNPNSSRALFLVESPDRAIVSSGAPPPTPDSITAQPALTPRYVPPFRRKRIEEEQEGDDAAAEILSQSLAELAIGIHKENEDLRRSFSGSYSDSGNSCSGSEGRRRSSLSDGSLGEVEASMFTMDSGDGSPLSHRLSPYMADTLVGVSSKIGCRDTMEDYHDMRGYFLFARSGGALQP